jgi:DNA-binding FadR family transcriptional regulator
MPINSLPLRQPSGVRRPAEVIKSRRFRTADLRIPKTAELIAEHIRRMIIRGELKDGDFLESQGQLIDSYAVSRPTIREAFRILEAEELISVSRGSRTGARVHRPKPDVVARQAGLVLQTRGTTLSDVYEARLAMEPCAARLLAKDHSAADISQLRECVKRAHDCVSDPARLAAAIADFHEALVELSGNQTLNLLITIVREIIRRHEARVTVTMNANRTSLERKQGAMPGLKSFDKLLSLIQASDERGAERHWRLHMENANKLWLEGYRGNAVIDLLD